MSGCDEGRGSRHGRRRPTPALRLKRAVKRALLSIGLDVRRPGAFGGHGAFEDQRRLLRAGAPDADLTIVDAGAHVGEVTARYRGMFPQARIHGFEPAPPAFGRLEQRFVDDERTFVYPTALSETCGMAKLNVNRDDATSSLLASSDSVANGALAARMETLERVDVPTTTLDQWCLDRGVDRIDLLKMDVQGAELGVLRGAERVLSAQAISLIYTEVSFTRMYAGQAFFWDVAGWLAGFGVELFNLYNCKTGALGQLTWGDAIFVGPRLLRAARSSIA